MTKQDLLCPISHVLCKDCALYRGRHYFLPLCKMYGSHTAGSNNSINLEPITAEHFEAFDKLLEPWRTEEPKGSTDKHIRLKYIDMESSEFKYVETEELKTLDWHDPQIMRLVDGRQITSWDHLVKIVEFMAEDGHEEIELYEGPRFMLLGGG